MRKEERLKLREKKAQQNKHLNHLSSIRDELRQHVNSFLESKGSPLRLHAIHLTDKPKLAGEGSFNCCKINGMMVCGPQCP